MQGDVIVYYAGIIEKFRLEMGVLADMMENKLIPKTPTSIMAVGTKCWALVPATISP